MFELRPLLWTWCVVLAACGGRDIGGIYGQGSNASTGAGANGGAAPVVTSTSSGNTTIGSSVVTTTGTSGVSSTSTGFGGAPSSGSTTGGGFAGAVGGAGGFTPCGPIICGPGLRCCNPMCGYCAANGQSCPNIGCGTGGAGGAGGGCGSVGQCITTLAGPCVTRGVCMCGACLCQTHACEGDSGCLAILECALKMNCGGPSCYTPTTCQPVIDRYGINSRSFQLALAVDQCATSARCPIGCNVPTVDAGPAPCRVPPAPIGMVGCSGAGSPDTCSQMGTDAAMNSYVAKCANGVCSCFYDGSQTCMCTMTSPNGTCGSCCPVWAPPPR